MKTFLRYILPLLFFLVFLGSFISPKNVYAADCVIDTDVYTNQPITPVTITGNKYGCAANIIFFCDGSSGAPDPVERCGLTSSCKINSPGESRSDAQCITGAIPTSTPTPTNTPGPTATPTPDPSKTCPDPNGGTPYNNGSILCGAYDGGSQRYSVSKCVDGQFKDAGYCNGRYTVSLPIGDACKTKGGPNGDSCDNEFVPLPTPDAACQTTTVGQLFPAPGENCGVPVEDPIGVDAHGQPIYDDTAPVHMCCHSSISNIEAPPLSCYLSDAPDVIKDYVLDPITNSMNNVIDSLPFIILGPDGPLTYGKLKQALKDEPACVTGAAPSQTPGTEGCVCNRGAIPALSLLTKYCDNIKDPAEQTKCRDCFGTMNAGHFVAGEGIYTSLGCISIKPTGFIQSLLGLGVSLGGGMALLCIMYSAFLYQTSQGSPENIKKAQELITSCITGLLLIIFSVFILRLIGYQILRIPGFS